MGDDGAAPRRAGTQDAAALATLRAVMLDAMGEGPAVAGDAAWHEATTAWLRVQLIDTAHFAAFVVDDDALGTVASACASLSVGAPIPGRAGAPSGLLFGVATDPRARRLGHSRVCVAAALAWLDGAGAARTSLSATPDAVAMYRDMGFVARPWVQMWR